MFSGKIKIRYKKSRAFALVEMMAVALIIGMMFVLLAPKLSYAGYRTKEISTRNDFRSMYIGIENALNERPGIKGFVDNTGNMNIETRNIMVEYINNSLDSVLRFKSDGTCSKKDAWNNEYIINCSSDGTYSSNNGIITVRSSGKDTIVGNEDDYTVSMHYTNGQVIVSTSGFSVDINRGGVDPLEVPSI